LFSPGFLQTSNAEVEAERQAREAARQRVNKGGVNKGSTKGTHLIIALENRCVPFVFPRQRILAFAGRTNDAATAERAARACSILPSTDKAELNMALALARRGIGNKNEGSQLSLGMVEYRSGNYAAADQALLAAAEAGKSNPPVAGTAAFYRALNLFRHGKPDEARKLAIEAAVAMKPLPKDDNNPLAGNATYDDLILWLAYKEATTLMQVEAIPPPKAEDDKK